MSPDPLQGLRSKLDPRLGLFLELGRTRLRKLREMERTALTKLRHELDVALEILEAAPGPAEIQAARQAAQSVRDRFFAPLTTGYHEPGDAGEPGAWVTGFDEPFVSGFVVSTASAQDLVDEGVLVRSQLGDRFTVLVPLSKVVSLAGHSWISSIELTRPLFPSARLTRLQFSGIQEMHTGSVKGKGVIIGIIDVWLNFGHVDFLSGGKTRVLHFWDQSKFPPSTGTFPGPAPAAPSPFGYGVEYSGAHIDHALGSTAGWWMKLGYSQEPTEDHGTKVAGCAAGSGAGAAAARGAAPEADIIFVKCKDLAGVLVESDPVAEAFQYIFDKAEALGRPCVVNLSYNDNVGPHDGTSLLDLDFEEHVSKPGRAITISAGNTNDDSQHADSSTAGTVDTVFRPLLEATSLTPEWSAQIWSTAGDEFDVRLEFVPAGGGAGTTFGPVEPDDLPLAVPFRGGSLRIQSSTLMPGNGDNLIRIDYEPFLAWSSLAGDWIISLKRNTPSGTNPGEFHAWIQGAQWKTPTVSRTTVAEPATSPAVITVGNHGFDTFFASQDENWIKWSPDSGCGPTRKNPIADKPDLVAEGDAVTVPSHNGYAIAHGTSYSAPLVAGAAALLFDPSRMGPTAMGSAIKGYLQAHAGKHFSEIVTSKTPLSHPEMYGQGRLRLPPRFFVPKILKPPAWDRDLWIKDFAGDCGFEPAYGQSFWSSPDLRVLIRQKTGKFRPVPNPIPGAPFDEHQVEVTVRNRGRRPARDVDVHLYWSGASTCIPFPEGWRSEGIFTGGARTWTAGNRIRIPRIAPGRSAKVRFGWSPRTRSRLPCAADHYSLLARIESEQDPSQIHRGGWVDFGEKNNIAVRNVLSRKLDRSGGASMTFLVEPPRTTPAIRARIGGEPQSLLVEARLERGSLKVELPVEALPWRNRAHLEAHGGRPAPFGAREPTGERLASARPLAGFRVRERTDVTGAARLAVRDGVATITAGEVEKLWIPRLRLAPDAALPVTIRVEGTRVGGAGGFVQATHVCGGRRVGAVTLEIRR